MSAFVSDDSIAAAGVAGTQANEAGFAYFDGLPRHVLFALQSSWDKVSAGQSNTRSLYKSLCRDFDEVGETYPPTEHFDAWIAGIQNGEVERPSKQIEHAPVLADAEIEAAAKPFDDAPLRELRDRMIEEAVAIRQRDIRRDAEKQVAARLRQMADALERAA